MSDHEYFSQVQARALKAENSRLRSQLEDREQLVRQAIVLGFVMGHMHGGGIMKEPPRDSQMVEQVKRAASAHSDLYPLLAAWFESGEALAALRTGRD